ncbi:hypothetical protein [Phytoactinopolyspora halotolerans]|uniref:ABM domain-containing protein n=1 Tax=Phytoactinopolyspora halotolerans TaxID=1981512 RepID=A0A6L9S700_9ACTN|nr:hypothetical protein [Phytoactinopolyspora halotolerans]NEE01245.1 hypothetical protein [Phytoactinopolyspora halotolerans]
MYVQVIEGRVGSEQALRAAMDAWREELAPGADGWLGATYGITDDGLFVGVVRFESEEAARHNSQRPEQDAWWREAARSFDSEVTFRDCTDVATLLEGGSDQAGFVQVLQGRVRDRDRLFALTEESASVLARERPEIIGATVAIDDEGIVTETVAFTSEAEAREGERKELGEEARRLLDEETALIEDIRYLDLREPWFASRS